MRGLFGASPHRLRSGNSRDSQDGGGGRPGNHNAGGGGDRGEGKRRSFAFMKYSPDRRSSASMKASREHSRQIAMQLSMGDQPEAAPVSGRKSKSRRTKGSNNIHNNSMNTANTFQPAFPEPSAFDDFNPFGHDIGSSTSFGSAAVGGSSRSLQQQQQQPAVPAMPPQEDFFAAAPPQMQQPVVVPPPMPAKQNMNPASFQRKASNASSHRSSGSGGAFPVRDNSFDTESVTSSVAYDMDFLPTIQSSQRDTMRKSSRGRPPRNKASSTASITTGSEISFGSAASSTIQWASQQQQQPQQQLQQQAQLQQQQQYSNQVPPPKSMSTFPSNSSMQATFAQTPPHHHHSNSAGSSSSAMMIMGSPPGSATGGGAAARRRMRSQLRHGSSNGSLQGSDTASFDGTPPPSPGSTRRSIFSSNGSVGSNNGMGNSSSTGNRNRVASYTMSSSAGGAPLNWQASPSPSFRGGGGRGDASVCSSVADSDIDLFDSQNGAGFTFDAFGLDASEIDREVQEAVQALEGSKRSIFGGFLPSHHANQTPSEVGSSVSAAGGGGGVNTSTMSKPQDTSGDDFAPQAWDSPPGSRRSTPTPKDDDDGFENGFRVSKPSPLPLINVQRESPVSSERSSSLSSITDHNTDGAPRRNVFKEKAGFTSSNNRRPRPSPSQAPKKQWVPPPGAIKMLTPPRHEIERRPRDPDEEQDLQPQQQQQQYQQQQELQRQQQQQRYQQEQQLQRQRQEQQQRQQRLEQEQQQHRTQGMPIDEDADSYWKDHLSQIPNMLKVDSGDSQRDTRNSRPLPQEPPQPQTTAGRAPARNESSESTNKKTWQSAPQRHASGPPPMQQQRKPQPASDFSRESSFRKEQEEKKDDDTSEERDNFTDTTAATTTVETEPSPMRPLQVPPSQQQAKPKASQQVALKLENLEKLVAELDEEEEPPREKALSPQEQRRKELEKLRNGAASSAGLKSQAFLHHSNHDAAKLKPQQERVNECNDQRSSFASLRERLKSSVETEQPNKGPHGRDGEIQQVGSWSSQLSPQSAAAKSEVGVSSFTRQKMKIAAMASSGSKSEANHAKSPRFSNSQHPEVNAVLHRVRGMTTMNAAKPGHSPTSAANAPAFMSVKLRKTSPPAALQTNKSTCSDDQNETQQSPDSTAQPRNLTYRERREMQQQHEQFQSSPRAHPQHSPSQAQKMAQNQHFHHQSQAQKMALQQQQHSHYQYPGHSEEYRGRESQQHAATSPQEEEETPPKKLTYRERRELELAKEREEKEKQEQAQKAQEPPKRDVADLIRRRIAANKSKPAISPSNDSQVSAAMMSQNRLRPTRRRDEDQVEESNSTEADRESIYAPTDEIGAHLDYRTTQRLAQSALLQSRSPRHSAPPGSLRANSGSFEDQNRMPNSPRQSAPQGALRNNAGSFEGQSRMPLSPRQSLPSSHSERSPRRPEAEPDNDLGFGGGLAALHAQLKQMREEEEGEEQVEQAHEQPLQSASQYQQQESLPEPPARPVSNAGGLSALHAQLKDLKVQGSEEEQAPTNMEQQREEPKEPSRPNLDKLEVSTAHSHTSDQHSSPSRTPKATYAMLNAFLHGRETVSEKTEAANSEQPEEEPPAGSPPKSRNMAANSSAVASDGRPALKDDPKYARYFTMLKIGMPMDVVKHAMVRDNLDPSVMDGDHNRPACTGIPLKDDPKYCKYFKMLKIGMPMEAVKHAMERDGLDSTVMDQDHNMPVESNKNKKDDAPKEKDSHRRARLHWKPLRDIRRNSLWAKIDEDPELTNLQIDEEEFAELFQVEIQPDGQQGKKGKRLRSPRKGAAVRVIDPKRANNGGIILARLKMSHDDMADVVDRIDENCMTAEQIEHIIEYLPSREERKALEAYMLEGGQDAAEKFDGLCECEKFMVSMMTVKHAKRKVRALLFKLQFESCLEALYQETHTVETSCDELSNSVRLRQLLGIVLTFGNRLNTAGKGKKKKAGAFTLDSLLKLNQAKAFDKKTTFLQYIVLIVQRNNELLLRFKDDLPTVFKADKVFWDQCISDLEEVENQLENVRRIALYQARQASKFRRKKKKHHDEDEDEESISDMSLSLEEEVEALRATPIGLFTLSAIKKVSFLRDRVEGTKVKFNKLLEYFGEESHEKHLQPHELFNIIVRFSQDWNRAQEHVFEAEKKKKREERKRQSKTGLTPNKAQNPPPNKRPHTGMLRASAMHDRYMSAPKGSHDLQQRSEQRPQPPAPRAEPVSPRRQSAPPASPSHQHPSVRAQETVDRPHAAHRRDSAPPTSPRHDPRRPTEEQLMEAQHAMRPQHEQEMYAPSSVPQQRRQAAEEQPRDPTHQMRHPQHEMYAAAAPSSAPPTETEEEYRAQQAQLQNASSHSIDLEEVIPRGMQDRGQLEQVPYNMPQPDQIQPSNSNLSASQMRRRARMKITERRQQRKGAPPAEETPRRDPPSQVHATSSRARADPPASSSSRHQMQRQTSAPLVASEPVPERGSPRRASATASSATSANHARNKARARQRLMERKQRAGRPSSQESYHI